MKTFDNAKDLRKYLETKAKKGEEVCLDERATMTHPRRVNYFKKKQENESQNRIERRLKNE